MKRAKLILLLTLLILLFANLTNAKVKLPSIVSSNMVLQRNTTIKLWGWAYANEEISIEVSWLSQVLNIEADDQGKWSIQAKTTNSKEPQTIKIVSKSSNIILENALLGEVWLCSGQSNEKTMAYLKTGKLNKRFIVDYCHNVQYCIKTKSNQPSV